jgi:hypothetical protein
MMLTTLENPDPRAAGARAVVALEVAATVLEPRDAMPERLELPPGPPIW